MDLGRISHCGAVPSSKLPRMRGGRAGYWFKDSARRHSAIATAVIQRGCCFRLEGEVLGDAFRLNGRPALLLLPRCDRPTLVFVCDSAAQRGAGSVRRERMARTRNGCLGGG